MTFCSICVCATWWIWRLPGQSVCHHTRSSNTNCPKYSMKFTTRASKIPNTSTSWNTSWRVCWRTTLVPSTISNQFSEKWNTRVTNRNANRWQLSAKKNTQVRTWRKENLKRTKLKTNRERFAWNDHGVDAVATISKLHRSFHIFNKFLFWNENDTYSWNVSKITTWNVDGSFLKYSHTSRRVDNTLTWTFWCSQKNNVMCWWHVDARIRLFVFDSMSWNNRLTRWLVVDT